MQHARLLRRPETCAGAATAHPDTDTAAAVEQVLAAWLHRRTAECRSLDRVFSEEVAEEVADFALRGGKRLRASFAWWGWRAGGGGGTGAEAQAALQVAASLELLQTLALIHDDVMDGSSLRRGSAAVHVRFASRHRAAAMRGGDEAFGVCGAVLAGDLALVWAEDMLAEAEIDAPGRERVRPLWRLMRTEMVAGQYLDLRAQGTADFAPSTALRVAALKSAAYTVERPLGIGAALAGASPETRRRLGAAARGAGLAFQLRDDVDGVFGDPAETGKPSGEDVREGKVTYLVALARRLAARAADRDALRQLDEHLGDADLAPDGLRTVREAVTRTGARAAVEERIGTLVRHSLEDLARAGIAPEPEARLCALVRAAARVPESTPEAVAASAPPGRAGR